MRGEAPPIGVDERLQRIALAKVIMREKGIDALYLDVSSSMTYFTGLKFRRTERMHSAVLPAKGEIVHVSPAFEVEKLRTMIAFGDKTRFWQEDEDPTETVPETVRALGYPSGTIAVDEATPFFTFDGLRRAGNAYTFINSIDVTAGCRMIKSEHELALMQTAKNITLEAHKAAARIMREGITTTEVQAFITAAHRKLGSEGDPPFNAVLFGEASAYPHGVPYPQTLKDGDMILIDTGAPVDGYLSDITRSYVFGEPTRRQRDVWNLEKPPQAAGFAAAKPGNRCEDIDIAARAVINGAGFGPGYATPGLPHRTGHGIGLDVHEWPYLVKGDKTVLKPGMTFSNERRRSLRLGEVRRKACHGERQPTPEVDQNCIPGLTTNRTTPNCLVQKSRLSLSRSMVLPGRNIMKILFAAATIAAVLAISPASAAMMA